MFSTDCFGWFGVIRDFGATTLGGLCGVLCEDREVDDSAVVFAVRIG